MSNLTSIERIKLEKAFDMGGGYVLDFKNRTFREFVVEQSGRDIYSDKYEYGSGSKANRLRAFWANEPNRIVGKLIKALLDYKQAISTDEESFVTRISDSHYHECIAIAKRLEQDETANSINSLRTDTDDENINSLAKSIQDSIENQQPEHAIDRLHTFMMRFSRKLCDQFSLEWDMRDPLQSLFGKCVKGFRDQGLIDSLMSERILKTTISILDAYNDVRNNKSLAHDNTILGYDEAMFICNSVANAVMFIESIKPRITEKSDSPIGGTDVDDLPF